MTETYSLVQIVLALFAAAGGGAGIIKGLMFLNSLWERRKANQAKLLEAKLHDTAELKRIATEAEHIGDEAIKTALWKIIEERKAEVEDLKSEIREMEQTHSLSRPTVQKLHKAVRELRKQVGVIEFMVQRTDMGLEHANLQSEVEILRQRLDEVENALP